MSVSTHHEQSFVSKANLLWACTSMLEILPCIGTEELIKTVGMELSFTMLKYLLLTS